MDLFATLLDRLVITPQRNRKIALLAAYFTAAPDPDRGYALACLTDGLHLKIAWRRTLLELMAERSDPVLYKLSRDYIGDTAETVSLLWPDAQVTQAAPRLGDVVAAFRDSHRTRHPALIAAHLDALDARGRWAFLKLVGGAPRAGVSARLAKVALAEWSGHDVAEIEEVWHALQAPYQPLFDWLEGRGPRPDPGAVPVFRPVMLAHPIEDADWAGFTAADYVAEWKWDGIRVQVSARATTCGCSRALAMTFRWHSPRCVQRSWGAMLSPMVSCWSCAMASLRRSTICSSGSTAKPCPPKC